MIPSVFFGCVALCSIVGTTNASKVLFLGDSNAKQIGTRLEDICEGAELTNAGVGGSTAEEWAKLPREMVSTCDEDQWDYVYISVGANDIDKSETCNMSQQRTLEVLNHTVNAIHNIMNVIAPGAKTYFMTGYCLIPYPSDDHVGCESPSDLLGLGLDPDTILKPLITVPEGSTFEIYDSTFVCGANETKWSDELYFRGDGVHLNNRGYCAVFSQPEIQDLLSCENAGVDLGCESLPKIPFNKMGIEENCANMKVRDEYKSSASASKTQFITFMALNALVSLIILLMG